MAKGPQTDATGKIVKPEPSKDPVVALTSLVEKMKPEMARALPRHITPDRMIRIVLTALRTTPKLATCTPASFLGCMMSLGQLGLEPNTPLGHAYLIPRNNRKRNTVDCTLIIGYQGMLDMARRSGEVDDVYAYAVREGDTFKYTLGTDRKIDHVLSEDPARETRKITHVYAVGVLKSGSKPFVVLTNAQIEARRQRSASANDGPWVTDYEAMALKTGVRALNPWLPKSAEMARAEALEVAADQGRSVLTAADDAVVEILASQGLKDDDTTSGAEVIEDDEKKEDGKQPGAQESEGGKAAPPAATTPGQGGTPSGDAKADPAPVSDAAAPALEPVAAPAETEKIAPVDDGDMATLVRLASQGEKMLKKSFLLESPKGSKAFYLVHTATLQRVNPKAERGVLVFRDGKPMMDREMCAEYVAAVRATLRDEAGVEAV